LPLVDCLWGWFVPLLFDERVDAVLCVKTISRRHETPHQAVVPKLVLDRVGMVRVSLFKKLLKVVHGRSCLMLAAAYGHRGMLHTSAASLSVDAILVIGRDLLAVLLVPLLAALLGILECDIRRCSSAVARGWVKLGHPVAGGVLSSDATPLLGGVLDGVGRCLKRPQQRPAMHVACRDPCHCPPGIMAGLPLPAGFVVTWVPHAPVGLRIYLAGSPSL
jgi:hypothetical protein